MAPDDQTILTEAIERNSAATLSLPSAGMVRYYKTRFLRGIEERVWVESVPGERALIESLIQSREPVEIAIKKGSKAVTFRSAVYHLDLDYRFFDAPDPLQALEILRPALIKPTQRRMHYRVPVRETDRFLIKVWRIAEHVDLSDEPMDIAYLPAKVRDLSVGGVGLIFKTRPLLTTGQRTRIILKAGSAEPMLLEGRSCPLREIEDGRAFKAGMQFQGLQASLHGRQQLTELTRLVQQLQLQEARRLRAMAG